MELENKNGQTQSQSDSSFGEMPVVLQPENASDKDRFICVAYYGPCGQSLEYEKIFYEWRRAGAELEDELKNLRENADKYSLHDCCLSLAEYNVPELKSENISEIKSLFLRIFNNEKFYFGDMKNAADFILEYCRKNEIPIPNEIQYVVGSYYLKWNFEKGFSNSEISLWKFIQKFLHEFFVELGSDVSSCQDATAMLYALGFRNSNYVNFDLSETVITIYSNSENYLSPNEFISRLPLNASNIADYEKAKKIPRCVLKLLSPQNTQNRGEFIITQSEEKRIIKGEDIEKRARNWLDNFACVIKNENCSGEEYRFYQYRAADRPKKNYKWLEINSDEKFLPEFDAKSESWLSAANYYSRFRRKANVASIDCNFLIIKWKKSELDFTPTPEQGKELVLSRCHELGLPEPKIISTPDGLEIKWFWEDRMTKILYEHDFFHSQFNKDWDEIQKKLYEKFWTLGADPKKLCATVMFSIPGSKDTRKTLKVNDDARIIREIHGGEIVESYRDIQRALGLKETFENGQPEIFDEIFEQKWQNFSENNEVVKDWLADVLKIHPSSQNWVCFGFLDENRIWNNRWTQAFEIRKFLMNLVHKPEFHECDFYVSQGEFFSRNDRTVNNLASINVNFVDLDYKILVEYRPEISENPTPEAWEELIKSHCEKFEIPLPNDIVFSGGGVHLKWIFDEPVSRAELALWQYAQKLLFAQFKTLGADPNSSDAARVLRIVGTLNHKNSPIVKDRFVKVIDREFFSKNKFSLRNLVEDLEKSQPENLGEFNFVKDEWQKTLAQLPIKEANMLRPESERKIDLDSPEFKKADEDWLHNTLHHHHPRATYLAAEVSGVTKWIETYQLHSTLKSIYGTPNLKFSLAELKEQVCVEKKEAIEWIPCNYVVLSRCPCGTFEEQKENIFKHCREYRDVGIQEPNQIIKVGKILLVEWTYQSVLTWRALSRWQTVQEFLCHHFKDWGALDSLEYLKATALLPVPGFEYDGETARLEYSDLSKRYTFNRLAKAVLNFSQKEVEEYRKQKEAEKAKHAPARKIALPENVGEKILNAMKSSEGKYKNSNFQIMAQMRYMDIIKFLELQREADGEIQQNTRELCCFWALNFARQSGMVTTYAEFEAKAEELINFCGLQFSTECTIATLKSAFKKHYSATTDYLIETLRITPEYQKHMKVLCVGVRATAKKHQPRAEWLAEHSQERNEVWKKYGVGRTKYFEMKKAGILPPLIEVEELHEEGRKCADRFINIMRARYTFAFIIRLLESFIQDFYRKKSLCVLFFSTFNFYHAFCLLSLLGLLYCRDSRILNMLVLFFLKRRRVKRKRKRRRK